MIYKHMQGAIGEIKAQEYFIRNGYNVYLPVYGQDPFDLVVLRENIFSKVSVRSTAHKQLNAWMVNLRSKSSQAHFDNTSIDLLFVYIINEDRSILFNAKEIKNKRGISIPILC